MTAKTKTILYSAVAAIASVLAYLATIPPSDQNGYIATVVALCPPDWRGTVGSACAFIFALAGFMAKYHAAHSGPQTPPANSPQS